MLDIEADNLVLFLGAGVSLSSPSHVPSAKALSKEVETQYELRTGQSLPPDVAGDLEKVADWFRAQGHFESQFLDQLIDWRHFRCDPNDGHRAVADFLGASVVEMAVTTNVDWLVEQAAADLHEGDFLSAIEAQEATKKRVHKPYVKLHGCMLRERRRTIWTRAQLDAVQEKQRIEALRDWLKVVLQNKVIVVIGFWTDWAYLTEALIQAVVTAEPQRVVLVTPDHPDFLKAKAPELWAWATSEKVKFQHVQVSGDEFLRDLRENFSQLLLKKLWNDAEETCRDLYGIDPKARPSVEGMHAEDLYALRQDLCGGDRRTVPREKRPRKNMLAVGATHLWLAAKSATLEGPDFVLGGKRVRVLDGSGRALSTLKRRGADELAATSDVVICAGALEDGGAPVDVVRGDRESTVARPAASGEWMTHSYAIRVFEGVGDEST